MTTSLTKFKDAYATMTVALYEPLILRWVSLWGIGTLADLVSKRAANLNFQARELPTGQALRMAVPRDIRPSLPAPDAEIQPAPRRDRPTVHDAFGRELSGDHVEPVELEGFPNAVRVGDSVYPLGLDHVEGHAPTIGAARPSAEERGNPKLAAKSIPIVPSGVLGAVADDFDFHSAKKATFDGMVTAAKRWSQVPDESLATVLKKQLKQMTGGALYEFFPTLSIEEALSPIGVANFHRQLFYNLKEGHGPIEQAFTVAPLETLEVVYETVRRQIHEEMMEVGSETVSERAVEEKNLEEVSDKVSSMIQRDTSASMSVSGGANMIVWQASASATAALSVSTQRSREEASRRLQEVTKRASERVTKSFSIKVRDVEDITTTNLTRRTIRNEGEEPVSYGLRRVLRRVRVKVQDLGPRLVWQLYVRNPGDGLARSRFVHFREAEPIAVPDIPPGVKPRPEGGLDTGSSSVTLAKDSNGYYAAITVAPGPGRVVKSVQIDSITDLEGGGKDDDAPSAKNQDQWASSWNAATNIYSTKIRVSKGDTVNVSVTYTYAWEPSADVMKEWDDARKAAVVALEESLMTAQFEREKALITERSKIRPRPAMELRKEERYEVMNRMISHLFARGKNASEVTPLEIEYFHRYFDLDAMFVYMHPSWWKPRYTPVASGLRREAYEITAESEPAPIGSSLGWMLQLDGDNRRQEFINSPWIRVCLPMRPNREREAADWLAEHIEGAIGFDLNANPLKSVFDEVKARRASEAALGVDGPDYISVDTAVTTPPANPANAEDVYPVVHEFDITVPTEGFVYDRLEVVN